MIAFRRTSALAETPHPFRRSRRNQHTLWICRSFEPSHSYPFRAQHPRRRIWLHVLLFVLTAATTTSLGVLHYLSFASDLGTREVSFTTSAVLQGLLYSATILGILGAHEMGHYLACRVLRVDATLPFFIPFPSIAGTLGAVIRIRQAFPTRRALFDIGIAGPIAGFIALIPALFIGLSCRPSSQRPRRWKAWNLGEPLLFQLGPPTRLRDDPRRLLAQHPSDGVRVLVRDAGDGVEPVAVRSDGRRAHLLCIAGRRVDAHLASRPWPAPS